MQKYHFDCIMVVDDVKAWRNSCIVANDGPKEHSNELREELTM